MGPRTTPAPRGSARRPAARAAVLSLPYAGSATDSPPSGPGGRPHLHTLPQAVDYLWTSSVSRLVAPESEPRGVADGWGRGNRPGPSWPSSRIPATRIGLEGACR